MKNIVLMAMSTLPKKLDSCDYFAENSFEKPLVKACVSQLEPVTRLCLQNTQDAADLIILGTEATLENDSLQGTDAVSFFLDRIAQTENGQEFQVDTDGAITYDYQAYHLIGKHVTRRISAAVIKIDEDQLIIAIEKAVQLIRSIRAEDEISLWIAANGGLRESYSYISAIVSLLKYDGIEPSHILSTETETKKIIDFSTSFRLFDFVTGINEFKEFGSINTLKKYYKGHENDPVILAMGKISDGTSQSNANLFTKGLNELRDLFLHEEKHQDSFLLTDSPEFRIFKSNIIEDYSPLLESNDYYFLDIVERCSKKNQIQQALSFIESKMCLDYLRTGLLCFNKDDSITIGLIDQYLRENGKKAENVDHFVVDTEVIASKKLNPSSVFLKRSSIAEFIYNVQHGIAYTVPFANRNISFLFPDNGVKKHELLINNPPQRVKYKTSSFLSKDDPFAELAYFVFQMHRMLKMIRNILFHGNEAEQDELFSKINAYSQGEVINTCISIYIHACRALFHYLSNIPEEKKQMIMESLKPGHPHSNKRSSENSKKGVKVTENEMNFIGKKILITPTKLSNTCLNLIGTFSVEPSIVRRCLIKVDQMDPSAARDLINKKVSVKIISVSPDGFRCEIV